MPVISFVSTKGGAGKTTSAVLLAGQIGSAGKSTVLIDADPNRPLEAWASLKPLPDSIRVVFDDSADTIVDTIEDARAQADFVLVDLEGTATDRVGFAIARSDLVLIPLQPSVLDATEAAKSVKLVRRMWRVINREVPYRALWTRVPPAIRERTAKDIERQFNDALIPTLPVALIERAAYRAMFSIGGTLDQLDMKDVTGLGAAKENAQRYAQAVIDVMKEKAA